LNKNELPEIFIRVKASTIDSLILVLLMLAASDVFSNLDTDNTTYKILTFVFIFVLYDPILVSLKGATIGHQICNIKVITESDNKKLNIIKAMIRFILKATLGWLSFFTVNSNNKKQALHDLVVNSIVVYND
jgi:uncharacterized RDD family membrane protein YckC